MMWQLHALLAMDLAREREAAEQRAAWASRMVAPRPSLVRRLFARTLRGVSDAANALGHASASAARSVDSAG